MQVWRMQLRGSGAEFQRALRHNRGRTGAGGDSLLTGRPLRLLCALLLAAVVLLDPGMALAGGLIAEFKTGVLWHDVPGLWSGFQAQPSSADINVEALPSPSVAFLGGAIRLQLEDWDRKALGLRVLFHIPAEVGWRFDDHNSLSAYFEHMSNAYTISPNEGVDRLGIRYGYRF